MQVLLEQLDVFHLDQVILIIFVLMSYVILFVEELRKEKRDEAFCGKRLRLGEDDNLEYEFTASDVMNLCCCCYSNDY